MEISSNIYGRKMKLYGVNGPTSGSTLEDIVAAFQNAVFLRNIDAGLVEYTSMLPLPAGALFSYDGIAASAVFNVEFAEELDGLAPGWQQMPVLYNLANYNGKVPLTQFLGLFPHKVPIHGYGYNMYFVTDDDVDGVQWFRVGESEWDGGFSKTTWSNASVHYTSFITIGHNTEDNLISCCLKFIVPNHTLAHTYHMIGSGYSQMRNQVFLSNQLDVPIELMRGFQDDYAPDDDPYSDGDGDDESGEGGGDGDHDDDSDEVDNDPLPTISATDTGFISLWNPSQLEIKSLANYMWSNLFDITTFKKLFADPMDCILGLSIMPGPVPSGAIGVVSIGNISTNISMHKCSQQFYEIDCGEINLKEYWGAYIDYSPYTKVELFLPYCGTHQINADEVMKKTIKIVYRVDVLSGACVASVKCGSELLYMFQGQCSVSIPITSLDWTNVINGMMNIAANFGNLVGTGGKRADSNVNEIVSSAVNNLKPDFQKTGAIESSGGLLAKQKPYFIITRPRQARPSYQNRLTGYPGFITRTIGELSGFTQMEVIRLSGVSATDEEMKEIEDLLKEGVIC